MTADALGVAAMNESSDVNQYLVLIFIPFGAVLIVVLFLWGLAKWRGIKERRRAESSGERRHGTD